MKIGIDLSLAVGQRAGVGQYSLNLVKELAKIDMKNEYTLFPFFTHVYNKEFKDFDFPRGPNFKMKFENLPFEWIDCLWRKLWIPKENFLNGLDLFHSTTFCCPNGFKGKIVCTIYDVSFKTHPEFHTIENIRHCESGTRQAVNRADVIVAISEHTKKDLIKYYDCPAEKIVVTHLGCDKSFRVVEDKEKEDRIRKKYKLRKGFVFNVGSIEPRKNVLGLVEAYAKLDKKYKNDFDLVIAGGKGWLNSPFYKRIKELDVKNNVKFIGYVDDEDLPILYNLAKVFVYPSFYEGFGLPILEAMACGCPVITSNVASMPEVVGTAGILVNPAKAGELEKALELLLGDTNKRNEMVEKGFEQAKKFSWEKCAKETLEIYTDLLN